MKLKIKSDGTPYGTTVEDEDGRRVQNIQSITWKIDVRGRAVAIIEVFNAELESEGTESVVTPLLRPIGPRDVA